MTTNGITAIVLALFISLASCSTEEEASNLEENLNEKQVATATVKKSSGAIKASINEGLQLENSEIEVIPDEEEVKVDDSDLEEARDKEEEEAGDKEKEAGDKEEEAEDKEEEDSNENSSEESDSEEDMDAEDEESSEAEEEEKNSADAEKEEEGEESDSNLEDEENSELASESATSDEDSADEESSEEKEETASDDSTTDEEASEEETEELADKEEEEEELADKEEDQEKDDSSDVEISEKEEEAGDEDKEAEELIEEEEALTSIIVDSSNPEIVSVRPKRGKTVFRIKKHEDFRPGTYRIYAKWKRSEFADNLSLRRLSVIEKKRRNSKVCQQDVANPDSQDEWNLVGVFYLSKKARVVIKNRRRSLFTISNALKFDLVEEDSKVVRKKRWKCLNGQIKGFGLR